MERKLVYLACYYKGNYNRIKKAIENGEEVSEIEIDKTLRQLKSNYVTILSENYPRQLRALKEPPFVLFYYGDLDLVNQNCISMIGMRECSRYGKEMATYFTKQLSNDFVIVSGLAKGIDGLCHQNAKKTIAVLGCGIDYCYPKENRYLYEWIKKDGLIISEYPMSTPPKPYYFPWRNRIVAALGLAVVVVEAKKRSGTMITVSHALELGKYVFAIPCRINDHQGTLSLIKDGAFCLENVEDIYEVLNLEKNH